MMSRRAWVVVTAAFALALTQPTLATAPGERNRPLTVTRVDDLAFGRIVADHAREGLVTIDPETGDKTASQGAADLGGRHMAARFEVRGAANRIVRISLPREIQMAARKSGGVATLADFQSSPADFARLDPRGRATILVGATLHLPAGTPRGNLRGAFDIVVEYD